ncbi:hypothetical protein ALMA_1415 [Alloscardovia macacae]|uniref:Uncharacterized protein n=2 Tax=Alloscardovia macacae TaxID=1160091 RepID=A0A261F218_9BIFI|nr:hypothetical protein ALMA_1415 [Alloscardovia macacae]
MYPQIEFPEGTDPMVIALTFIVISLIIAGSAVIKLWLERADRRSEERTEKIDLTNREALDHVLENTPTMSEVKAKLDRDYHAISEHAERIDTLQETVDDMYLSQLRARLFAHPRSRVEHEELLEVAQKYIELGGNGLGHVRAEWLEERYKLRLTKNNWDYTRPLDDKEEKDEN